MRRCQSEKICEVAAFSHGLNPIIENCCELASFLSHGSKTQMIAAELSTSLTQKVSG